MYEFDKTRRLITKSEYDYVFAQGKKILTPEFVILYRSNCLGYARLGLSLSKKRIAKACQRNRLKRIVRESFRTQNLPAVDIVFLARHGAAKVENSSIIAHLGNAWKKLNTFYVD
ncbi:ribonuclease P protein component (RNase P) [Legionella beliardensis]|uniref:Ribonuclease P protein component n=1 Tax=Legionella beliardensis TaxID=91822 RepID=A0A378I678_9GAMM|nr:ribonuclease P protein component [Legionella beliardensis]STX30246.1 ribonuclease P protein component (RNase P) [Legionella beliardensis]